MWGMKKKRERDEKKWEGASRVRETALEYAINKEEFGLETRSDEGFESIEAIRRGLPIAAFYNLQERLQVGTAELAEVVGIPVRTLQRRKDEGHLTKEESDRLDRLDYLIDLAQEVFGSAEAARQWFTQPQLALAGMTPLELADTSAGLRELSNLLGRIDYGVYA